MLDERSVPCKIVYFFNIYSQAVSFFFVCVVECVGCRILEYRYLALYGASNLAVRPKCVVRLLMFASLPCHIWFRASATCLRIRFKRSVACEMDYQKGNFRLYLFLFLMRLWRTGLRFRTSRKRRILIKIGKSLTEIIKFRCIAQVEGPFQVSLQTSYCVTYTGCPR